MNNIYFHENTFWFNITQNLITKNLKTSILKKKQLNLFIETHIGNLSYYPLGDEYFRQIFKKWLHRRLKKKNKKINMVVIQLLTHYILENFKITLLHLFFTTSIFNIYVKNFLIINLYTYNPTLKYIGKINKYNHINLIKIEVCSGHIIISNRQLFGILFDCSLKCLWNCSNGLLLKKLKINDKYLKRQNIFWNVFLRFFKKKISDTLIVSKMHNALILKGQHRYFLNLILLFWRLDLFNFFNFLILKFNLPYTNIKYKTIKAIKRKLTKRFLKINNKSIVEAKNLKKTVIK